jgi:hypothetical protein
MRSTYLRVVVRTNPRFVVSGSVLDRQLQRAPVAISLVSGTIAFSHEPIPPDARPPALLTRDPRGEPVLSLPLADSSLALIG